MTVVLTHLFKLLSFFYINYFKRQIQLMSDVLEAGDMHGKHITTLEAFVKSSWVAF